MHEMQTIIADLHAARDGMTDGPAVLWLVNDLVACFESRIEALEDAATAAGAVALARQNFLSRLTGFAEDIRRSNGALSDEFLAFIETAQIVMDPPTTN
tara:strand:+ start:2890 stop:3186 length:297 start_codon:yes stop_codon:yes gene_type:complete